MRWSHTGLYGAIQNYMEKMKPYRTIKSHAGQYRAIQVDMKLFMMI